MSIHHVLLRIVFYSLTNEDPNDNYFSIIPGVQPKTASRSSTKTVREETMKICDWYFVVAEIIPIILFIPRGSV
jgi:hypothetical protein